MLLYAWVLSGHCGAKLGELWLASIFIIPCTATLFALMVVNNWYIVMVSDWYIIDSTNLEKLSLTPFYADGGLDLNIKTNNIITHAYNYYNNEKDI